MKRRRKRREVKKTDRVGPTPETKAKRQDDPIQMLVDKNLLSSAGESAAAEIEAVYLAVTKGCMAKITSLEVTGGGDIPDWIAEAHAERFLPWARRQARATLEATIDLVVYKRPPEDEWLAVAVVVALEQYGQNMG